MPVRTFTGLRPRPPAGYETKGITNAGTAPDYEGAVFSDGTVVVRWLTEYRSHSVWACWDDFYRVHGHPEYGTRIVFTDQAVPVPEVWCPACLAVAPITYRDSQWVCTLCGNPLTT